jgi:[CysO sulfur-carrier protein]-S-L-cysteine hydrolase
VKLRLPPEQINHVMEALQRAGLNETGGQLYGEQLSPSHFRVTAITVQRRMGTVAQFVVDMVQAAKDALRFFDRTNHKYDRFNYIGEWHSHPMFAIRPSSTDVDAMRSIVEDRAFKGNFAVLMIVRLEGETLGTGAWVFATDGREGPVTVESEHD